MKPLGPIVGSLMIALAVGGCGGSSATSASNAADTTFLQDMIAHHLQAIAAGQLAADHGTDSRVTAFGRRIVREQTPELQRLQAMVTSLKLTVSGAAGARMAVNLITPAQLSSLAATSGPAFDRAVIGDSATSEMGAVQMATVELAHGSYPPALTIARSIASAANPGGEISQLKQLAAALPS